MTTITAASLARITQQPGYAIIADTGQGTIDMSKTPDHKRMEEQLRNLKGNARKTVIDGIVFDSAAESRRYQSLKTLERAGVISDLETQPNFVLQESFKDCAGKRHRPITYTADFRYIEAGQTVIEDVKGEGRPLPRDFTIKWKWAIKQNPTIRFEIVRMK